MWGYSQESDAPKLCIWHLLTLWAFHPTKNKSKAKQDGKVRPTFSMGRVSVYIVISSRFLGGLDSKRSREKFAVKNEDLAV